MYLPSIDSMGRGPPCCCCFSNNVRHLTLLLSLFCVSSLFANLILFNFTSVLHKNLESGLKPVASLTSLHEYSTWHDRFKRGLNSTSDNLLEAVTNEREGFPILPPDYSSTTRRPTTISTTIKPTTKRLIFFTNEPTSHRSTRVVRATTASPVLPVEKVEESSTTPTVDTTTRNVILDEIQKSLDKIKNKDKDVSNGYDTVIEKSKADGSDIFIEDPASSNYFIRSLLFASPGLGCILGTLLSMLLIRCFGVRIVFSASLFLSSMVMILFGFVVPLGFAALFPLRFILGVCFSASLPVIGSIVANWGALKEQITFIAVSFLFVTIGPVFSWPLTMILYSNEVDLKYIYVLHAVVTLLLAFSFLIFYRDRPQYHPWVNGLELNRIVAGKVQELKHNRVLNAPWTTLLRSISAWAIWVAAFGFFSIISLLSSFLPSFLSSQQVFMVDNLGLYAILPYTCIPLCIVFGGIANRFACSSTTIHLRICNTVSFVLTAFLIVAIPILFSLEKDAAAIHIMLLSLAPLGLSISGYLKSATIVGRLYSQHIIGCFGYSFGLAYTMWPFIVNCFIKENLLNEWMRVFLLAAAFLVITAIVFAVFGRGRSAGWAESSWDPLVQTKMRSLNPIDRSQDECGLYEMRLIGPSKR